jgi:hypothetical protein
VGQHPLEDVQVLAHLLAVALPLLARVALRGDLFAQRDLLTVTAGRSLTRPNHTGDAAATGSRPAVSQASSAHSHGGIEGAPGEIIGAVGGLS